MARFVSATETDAADTSELPTVVLHFIEVSLTHALNSHALPPRRASGDQSATPSSMAVIKLRPEPNRVPDKVTTMEVAGAEFNAKTSLKSTVLYVIVCDRRPSWLCTVILTPSCV